MIIPNLFKLNRADFFILGWVLYYLQGILYASGSIISTSILGINFIISIVCCFNVLRRKDNPIYFKGLNILLLIFTLYGVIYILSNKSSIYYPLIGISVSSYEYLKAIYLSLLPIYPFYFFSVKGYLTSKKIRSWSIVLFCSAILSFFRSRNDALTAVSGDEITNNAGYLFVSLFPLMVLFRKKPLTQMFGLIIIIAFVIFGMKRGAILVGVCEFIYLMLNLVKQLRGRHKLFLIIIFVLLSLIVCYLFLYQMTNSSYMQSRLEATIDGDSSGRDTIFSFFWIYFTEKANFLHYVFGRGANGTLDIYYNYAHNDWLEIAVNQGLLGLSIYLFYWICFFKTWKLAKNKEAKLIIALTILIYFPLTIFSMSYGDMSYFATCLLGFALANINSDVNQKIN